MEVKCLSVDDDHAEHGTQLDIGTMEVRSGAPSARDPAVGAFTHKQESKSNEPPTQQSTTSGCDHAKSRHSPGQEAQVAQYIGKFSAFR